MELHGVAGAPYKHPEVRRKLPAAFTRHRIDLDGGRRVKRDWQDVSIADIEPGDTIAGFGVVDGKAEFIDADSEKVWRIRLFNVMGDYEDFPGEQRVFAFAQKPKTTNG